jgi:Ion channel
LGECDFSNAFLNAIDFSTSPNRVACTWKFTELQYFSLLRYCLLAFQNRFSLAESKRHSVFWMIKLPKEELFDSANDYIEWFEGTHLKLQQMSKSSTKNKLSTLIVMISTMNWRSIEIFSCWMFLLVSIFAMIYVKFGLLSSGGKTVESILDCFYFSVITFTTLGYGDVLPTGIMGKLFVIAEVISGYISLGLLLTILGRKIKWK